MDAVKTSGYSLCAVADGFVSYRLYQDGVI